MKMLEQFELSITYQGENMDVIVQPLSDEYPLIYAVWPKDESLKKSFDNTFVTFTITDKSDGAVPTIWHKVHYSKDVKSSNLEFEMAIWERLLSM